MWLVKKIIDLLLYGNFWIALGGLVLTLQTQYILDEQFDRNMLAAFVFFSTWLLYALHRIVGILRLKDFLEIERYGVIAKFRHHIIVYAIIATIGSVWYFFQLSFEVQIALFLPGIFSLGYVLPFFGKQRRLRDFNQIKIFLVALVWAWVTVILPAVASGYYFDWSVVLMFLERALFVFAITLPFDIRDIEVDGHSAVQTIPAALGVQKTIRLALGLLIIASVFAIVNKAIGFYTMDVMVGLLLSFISTAYLIRFSSSERHDYYYSGLMDGTMILQGVLVGLCYFVF